MPRKFSSTIFLWAVLKFTSATWKLEISGCNKLFLLRRDSHRDDTARDPYPREFLCNLHTARRGKISTWPARMSVRTRDIIPTYCIPHNNKTGVCNLHEMHLLERQILEKTKDVTFVLCATSIVYHHNTTRWQYKCIIKKRRLGWLRGVN